MWLSDVFPLEVDFVLTRKCNRNCGFCYADSEFYQHGLFPVSVEETAIFANKVVNLLKSELEKELNSTSMTSEMFWPGKRPITIGFTGGESTLVPVEVYRTAIKILNSLSDYCNLTYTFTTNGSYLTEDYLHLFAEAGVKLSLSFDGFYGSFKDLKELVNKVCKILPPDQFSLHFLLVRKNTSEHVLSLLEEIADYYGIYLDFSFFIPSGRGLINWKKYFLSEDELIWLFNRILNSPRVCCYRSFISLVSAVKSTEGSSTEAFSFYLNHVWGPCWLRLRFELDGYVYSPCLCITNKIRLNGVFTLEEVQFKTGTYRLKQKLFYQDDCKGCYFFNFCMGGCIPYKKHLPVSCGGLKKVLTFLKNC